MIIKTPFPLLEASFFLAGKATGNTSKAYFERKTVNSNSPFNKQTAEYSKLIFELERRLEKSITVEESIIKTLFEPFTSTQSQRIVSTDFAANIIVQNIINYINVENCFDALRESGEKIINNSIMNWLNGNADYLNADENAVDNRMLFDAIKASPLPSETKFLLLDISMHYGEY
ncbi:MAG TPA: hypothetical protein DCY17_07215, partial [Clostridiales bacterium]|nr:hypothetical protein [Clostridiales bacterium]